MVSAISVLRGLNPCEEEVQDITNKVDMEGRGKVGEVVEIICILQVLWFQIEWEEFGEVLADLLEIKEDEETSYKETFRVFSKDKQGCIPAEEMKFALSQICSLEVSVSTEQAGTERGQAQLRLVLDLPFFLKIWFLPIWIGRIGLIKYIWFGIFGLLHF